MASKSFDLNIEKILENWEVRHAIREVIANALDEQLLTGTASVDIEKRAGIWVVRDYGRGIRYTHLTQNENQEKLESSNVIGRFGIGLKDALATFERHHVSVRIRSKHGTIQTTKAVKHGFGDIVTLHAIIEEPEDNGLVGTAFEMLNVDDREMQAAKELFLRFANEEVLD
ncbi:MAG: ATP-binding protein, partial [Burkholderiales bacterium]